MPVKYEVIKEIKDEPEIIKQQIIEYLKSHPRLFFTNDEINKAFGVSSFSIFPSSSRKLELIFRAFNNCITEPNIEHYWEDLPSLDCSMLYLCYVPKE